MSDRPTVQLDTPFGVAEVTVTTGRTIYVDMGRNGDDMTVNRVPMQMSLYMTQDGDADNPRFVCVNSGMYLSRADTYKKDVSCAAYKKVMDTMVALVSSWAVDNPDMMEKGFDSDRDGRVLRCEAELDCLLDNARGKKEEIRAIQDEVFGN